MKPRMMTDGTMSIGVRMSTPQNDEMLNTTALRNKLKEQKNIRFVDYLEYCRLLVSFRWLTRSDVPRARILGLQDPMSGMWYVIEEEKISAA